MITNEEILVCLTKQNENMDDHDSLDELLSDRDQSVDEASDGEQEFTTAEKGYTESPYRSSDINSFHEKKYHDHEKNRNGGGCNKKKDSTHPLFFYLTNTCHCIFPGDGPLLMIS